MAIKWPWSREQSPKITDEQLAAIEAAISEAITMSQTRETGYETEQSGGTGFVPQYGYERTSYEDFHNLYHGNAESGMQIGALLSQPVVNLITAFIISNLPKVVVRDGERFQKSSKSGNGSTEDEKFNQYSGFLNKFLADVHPRLIEAIFTSVKLGDAYVVFGTDRDLEVIAPYPSSCHPGFNAFSDKLHHFRTEVERVLDDPQRQEKIKAVVSRYWDREEYIFEATSDDSLGNVVDTPKIQNSHDLGEVPVVHFANNREPGNVFGISELRPLIPFMNLIHSTIVRGWEAQQYMGKPILKVTGIKGNVASWLFKTFGIRVENAADESDALKTAMFNFFRRFKFLALTDEADANYIESRYVTGATEEIYRMVFKLFVNTSLIPEFLFGSAIESANAAVREQYSGLRAYIAKKQIALEPAIIKLCKFALYYYSTLESDEETGKPLPTYNFVTNPEELETIDIKLIWPKFLNSDEAMKNDAIKMLLEQGVLSKQTAIDNYKELIPHGDKELDRVRSEFSDTSLPQSGKQSSGQDQQQQRDTQRSNDDKGNPGNNSGRSGSGTGKRAAGVGQPGEENEEILEIQV